MHCVRRWAKSDCASGLLRALRLDRQDLFDVLADHPDLLQSIFACVLDAGRADG